MLVHAGCASRGIVLVLETAAVCRRAGVCLGTPQGGRMSRGDGQRRALLVLNLQPCEVVQRIKYPYYLSMLRWVKCFSFTPGWDFKGFHFPLLSSSPFSSGGDMGVQHRQRCLWERCQPRGWRQGFAHGPRPSCCPSLFTSVNLTSWIIEMRLCDCAFPFPSLVPVTPT